MSYRNLTDADLDYLALNGEFSTELLNRAEKVVIILTQDWCPDWHAMKVFLPDFSDKADIYVLEYNRHPRFETIMAFKEDHFKNREIPYLRYYYKGKFIAATNRIPKGTFEALLKKTEPFEIR